MYLSLYIYIYIYIYIPIYNSQMSEYCLVCPLSLAVNQLQTFTNIALMTHCEDGSFVDRLTSLETVGSKLAPLIFDFEHDVTWREFIIRCNRIKIVNHRVHNSLVS